MKTNKIIYFFIFLTVLFPFTLRAEETPQNKASEKIQNESPSKVTPQQGMTLEEEAQEVSSEEDSLERFDFTKLLEWRDPFQKPYVAKVKDIRTLTPLEIYPVIDFKFLGVVTGPKKIKAMIQAPDGKTYFISTGDKLGKRGGIVRKILIDTLTVEEVIENVLGQKEKLETKLVLPSDLKLANDKS